MTRLYMIFGLLILSIYVNGQDYEFKAPKNCILEIGLLDSYFQDSTIIGDTITISHFDNYGLKTKTIQKSSGRIESINCYKYDNAGHLIEYKDYGRQTHQLLTDQKTGKEIETSQWDSSIVMMIKKYQYDNGLLIRIDEYSFGDKLDYTTLYDYDNQKRAIKELSISYPDENTLVYFKPNSTEIDWSRQKQTKIEAYTKSCHYIKDLRICIYSDSSGIKSSDTSIFKNGLIVRSIAFDSKSKFLKERKYNYNNQQLIEYTINDSGIGHYGGGLDMIAANRFKYEYDNDGLLIAEYHYDGDRLLQKYYYKRIKR
jgi:hypothetical protein